MNKALVFGSLNIDHVYRLPHLVREGETLASLSYRKNPGGKGLNQAIALSRAGQETFFAGAIGEDGVFLKELLSESGVGTEHLRMLSAPTGHAIIEVDENGTNSIILFGGANMLITESQVMDTLSYFGPGDLLLIQHETSCGAFMIEEAARRGMIIVLNPSPMSEEILHWPLHLTDYLVLNEIEGEGMTGTPDPEQMIRVLREQFPETKIVLTLGEKGSIYADSKEIIQMNSIPTAVVDTTAAGDTFTGFFFASVMKGFPPEKALSTASHAASVAVSRPGAASSIPAAEEVFN